jgi:hypothetical protein
MTVFRRPGMQLKSPSEILQNSTQVIEVEDPKNIWKTVLTASVWSKTARRPYTSLHFPH